MHDPTPQRVDSVAESEHFERVTLLTTLITGNVMNLAADDKNRKVAAVPCMFCGYDLTPGQGNP